MSENCGPTQPEVSSFDPPENLRITTAEGDFLLTHHPHDPAEVKLALQEISESIDRSLKQRARWPEDYRLAMTELANLFPTMRGVPGTGPWDVHRLIAWMNSGAPTSGSWHAALFLLGVWSATQNWRDCGLKAKKGHDRFDLFRAMAVWDHYHMAAMQEWVANPFWP